MRLRASRKHQIPSENSAGSRQAFGIVTAGALAHAQWNAVSEVPSVVVLYDSLCAAPYFLNTQGCGPVPRVLGRVPALHEVKDRAALVVFQRAFDLK